MEPNEWIAVAGLLVGLVGSLGGVAGAVIVTRMNLRHSERRWRLQDYDQYREDRVEAYKGLLKAHTSLLVGRRDGDEHEQVMEELRSAYTTIALLSDDDVRFSALLFITAAARYSRATSEEQRQDVNREERDALAQFLVAAQKELGIWRAPRQASSK